MKDFLWNVNKISVARSLLTVNNGTMCSASHRKANKFVVRKISKQLTVDAYIETCDLQ